jgi:hypothetical protein
MKFARLLCACTLILLGSVPLYASWCESCDPSNPPHGCMSTPGSNTICMFGQDYCESIWISGCARITDADEPVLTDWTVASIEVSRPDGTKVVTAPVAIAEADDRPADLQ